jgi:hypothetical protein
MVNPYSPPEAAIDPAIAPVVEGGGFKSTAGIAKAIGILMVLYALLELGGGVSALLTISVMRRVAAGEVVDNAALTAIDARAEALRILVWTLVIPTIVLFCLFMTRANRNAHAFGAPMSNSPGWAAGWFFIPVAGWWKPYYAMKEIWLGSDPDPNVHALQSAVSPLLPLWWWMFLLREAGGMSVRLLNKRIETPADLIESCWAQIVCLFPSAAAAVLAAAVVRGVARRQQERQARRFAPGASLTTAAAP